MNDKKRIIEALQILRKEAPRYFDDILTTDCPSDLGLPAEFRKWCGMEEGGEICFDYCAKCWQAAMKEVKP